MVAIAKAVAAIFNLDGASRENLFYAAGSIDIQ
jgi:hypothetical protein